MLMLFPYLNQKHEAFKVVLWLQGLLSAMGGITMLVAVGIFGDLVTARLVFPYNTLVGYISGGSFIERMNILLVIKNLKQECGNYIIDCVRLPKWRNWQTRRTQNPFLATGCGFKSLLRHQRKTRPCRQCRVFDCKILE